MPNNCHKRPEQLLKSQNDIFTVQNSNMFDKKRCKADKRQIFGLSCCNQIYNPQKSVDEKEKESNLIKEVMKTIALPNHIKY